MYFSAPGIILILNHDLRSKKKRTRADVHQVTFALMLVLVKARTSSMKSLAIGLGVRFFNEMETVGGVSIPRAIGRILIRMRLAPNRSAEFGMMAINRRVSMSRARNVIELDTTCGAGGVSPAEAKASAINDMATLSTCGMSTVGR